MTYSSLIVANIATISFASAPRFDSQTAVIAGSDLGFRIENRDNVPIGKLVVRINGRWVDAQVGASGIVPR